MCFVSSLRWWMRTRPGYEGAAYESLGLVTRFWHSPMVNVVRNICERSLHMYRLLLAWRRTLTLLPAVILCRACSPWLAIEREAPYELALLNMTAGLAWATTIVNVRQPELMENFISMNGNSVSHACFHQWPDVDTDHGNRHHAERPVHHGVSRIPAKQSDPALVQLWDTLVAQPAREAVNRIHPILQKARTSR